jgi:hypothetical protein
MEDPSRYYALLEAQLVVRRLESWDQEKIEVKELHQTLGLGVGVVYYHSDMLSDFLTQDRKRKHKLNEWGKRFIRC